MAQHSGGHLLGAYACMCIFGTFTERQVVTAVRIPGVTTEMQLFADTHTRFRSIRPTKNAFPGEVVPGRRVYFYTVQNMFRFLLSTFQHPYRQLTRTFRGHRPSPKTCYTRKSKKTGGLYESASLDSVPLRVESGKGLNSR